MSSCPVCLAQIEITTQHHGTLFTCPQCQAVFFVGWDGQPEVAAAPSEHVEGGFPEPSETPAQFAETVYGGAPSSEPEEEISFEEEPPVENYDFSQPLGTAETQEPEVSGTLDTADFSDVTDFANQEQQLAALNYTIIIHGIDSAEVRILLKEALTDSKLGWQADQILAQIKGGVLTIKSVNPVKASIIVQRVKYLPVQISWRQDVLSNP